MQHGFVPGPRTARAQAGFFRAARDRWWRRCAPVSLALGAISLAGCGSDASVAPSEPAPPSIGVGSIVRWKDKGVLAEADAPYGRLQILRLQGSHYDMGYQYGYLMHAEIESLWKGVFIPYVAKEGGIGENVVEIVFGGLLDEAWKHMEPYTPPDYLDELRGVADGAAAAGAEDPDAVAKAVRYVMLLAELSQSASMGSDIAPFQDLVVNGYSQGFADYFGISTQTSLDPVSRTCREGLQCDELQDVIERISNVRMLMKTCSFFAVWGDRTDGRQIASRLLDWERDIGLQDYRLVTVFVPDGGTPHMTIGYVGFLGALAGMSANGIALGHVGATSIHERLDAEPGTLKSREILEHSSTMSDAFGYFTNTASDGRNRPSTIGANAMLAFGDPEGGGAAAEGVAAETTGIFSSAFRYGPGPDCGQAAYLVELGRDGTQAHLWNDQDNPDVVNLEGDAYEIGADGKVRTFQVDGSGQFVTDANGALIEDPAGQPYRVGLRMPCAVFRGDEAMAYGVRKYQLAANGPQGDSATHLMHESGSYRGRYLPQHDMIDAYYTGRSFTWEGETVIEDNSGVRVPIGPEEGKRIAKVAAMSSNVFAVIYDTTNVVAYVAYESGTGDGWTKASDNGYFEVKMSDVLP